MIARIGTSANGAFAIDLVEDGPHLLIAGTTGAGKSELLRTLVTSLACEHGPDRLSFVLIDYKGGAAFAECAGFPHVLGLVTDLDAQLTRRALISLDAELRRREEAFAAAGVADLDGYQASPRAQQVLLTRLVLVIDEFASLVEELPDFMNGLLGIAQRGRSLGVHLVLATQRPAGVLSQDIKANMSLRIALRVTDAAESIDVINDAAASRISRQTPGRAFARRTDGDLIEFQAAAVSLPILGSAAVQVRLLDEWNRPIRYADTGSAPSELQALGPALRAAAADTARPPRPWLDPLPDRLICRPRSGDRHIQLGLLDEPHRQRQAPLVHDLDTGGALALIGGARSGRTSGLRTCLGLAVSQLTAAELHLYVIDCGGGLARAGEFEHCGTYVDASDPSRIGRLVSRLVAEARRRQRLLAEWGVSDPGEARARGHHVASVLVLIDGWDALVGLSDDIDGGRTAEDLVRLLRDGPSSGFSFVLSGDRALLSARVSSVLQRRLLLPLTDAGDYVLAAVSPDAVPPAARSGQGVESGTSMQFQLGLLAPDGAAGAQWAAIDPVGGADASDGPTIRLVPLPGDVALSDLPTTVHGFVLGLGDDDAHLIDCELTNRERQFLISGPARSGKSNAALVLAHQAVQRGLRVTVAATSRSPLASWARQTGLDLLGPNDMAAGLDTDLVVVDDAEQFVDSSASDDLVKAIAADEYSAVVTARSEDLLVSFRGLGVEMRRHRCGILLQPSAVDGELLGVRIPRGSDFHRPGRGVLVTDSTRETPEGFVAIQLARL